MRFQEDCRRRAPLPRRDVSAIVDTLSRAAVDAYYADRRAAVLPFYLYFVPSAGTLDGRLAFIADGDDAAGWVIAEPQGHRGALPREALYNHVRALARRLPILAPDC